MSIPLARIRYLAYFATAYEQLGGDCDSLLRKLGIAPEILESPDSLMPLHQVFGFAEHAWNDVGASLAHCAASRSLAELGPLGRALAEAPTLRMAFHRFIGVVGSQSARFSDFFVEPRAGALWVGRRRIPAQGPLLACLELCSLYMLLAITRHWAGARWVPDELWMQSDSVDDLQEFRAVPRLHLGASVLCFPVPHRLLDGSAHVSAVTTAVDSGLGIDLDRLDFIRATREILRTYLVSRPSLESTSQIVGMSPRTFQRRLDEAGASFSHLLARVRLEEAIDYLRRDEGSISELARRLGYSDPAHFSRAFRRWVGITPQRFRRTCHDDE